MSRAMRRSQPSCGSSHASGGRFASLGEEVVDRAADRDPEFGRMLEKTAPTAAAMTALTFQPLVYRYAPPRDRVRKRRSRRCE
jgi:hypothetical protein